MKNFSDALPFKRILLNPLVKEISYKIKDCHTAVLLYYIYLSFADYGLHYVIVKFCVSALFISFDRTLILGFDLKFETDDLRIH